MKNTLKILVTCTKESTRYEILKHVVSNLQSVADEQFFKDMIVFDNASSYPGSISLIENFFNVFQSNKNFGFWSAIFWCLNNYESILGRDYKYVYIIESDLIHTNDALKRLQDCETFLDLNNDVGHIRTEEFLVSEKHLYDKQRPRKDSRKYAWVTQENGVENKRVDFHIADPAARIYKCNFLAKLPALSRLSTVKSVFSELSKMKSFVEADYQRLYYQHYRTSAVLDGGVFHSKLSNEDIHSVVNGSANYNLEIDYLPTRFDSITKISKEDVKNLNRNFCCV
jgi:hypothetical protein